MADDLFTMLRALTRRVTRLERNPPAICSRPHPETVTADCSYASGFGTAAGTVAAHQLRVCRVGEMVMLEGGVSGHIDSGTETVVATVPAGFRPARETRSAAIGSSGRVGAVCRVSTGGAVQMQWGTHSTSATNNWVVNVTYLGEEVDTD